MACAKGLWRKSPAAGSGRGIARLPAVAKGFPAVLGLNILELNILAFAAEPGIFWADMNYKISRRAAALSPSLTLAIDSKAKQMKAEGQDVVGFGAGEPDFDTPQHIKDAAIKALNEGINKYITSSSIPELRQAIADKFKRENGLSYKPSQIIVSSGGKHSCYNTIMATSQ